MPVVREGELLQHLFGILGGALHGAHARCLLAAVVFQHGIVQSLHSTETTEHTLLSQQLRPSASGHEAFCRC